MIKAVAISLLAALLVSGCAADSVEEPVLIHDQAAKTARHSAKSRPAHKKSAKSHKKQSIPTCVNPVKKSTPKKQETAKKQQIIVPTTTSFAIFFEQGKAGFATQSEPVLSSVIKTLAKEGSYIVVISDKSKGGKDDAALSLERIQAVKSRLQNEGIKESAIEVGNKVKQVNHKVNHKVEIFLND